jgi:hypothetical protein
MPRRRQARIAKRQGHAIELLLAAAHHQLLAVDAGGAVVTQQVKGAHGRRPGASSGFPGAARLVVCPAEGKWIGRSHTPAEELSPRSIS